MANEGSRTRSRFHSALSGDPLDGGSDPTPLTITFADGEQRSVQVTAAEAETLRAHGEAISAPRWVFRIRSRMTGPLKALFIVILSAWFASVVIPAIVQQWADRKEELEFKNTLITAISDTIGDTHTTILLIRQNLTPQALERQFAEIALRDAPPTERVDARAALRKALVAELTTEQTLYSEAQVKLIKNGATLETRLVTYLNDTPTPESWKRYRDVLLKNLQLVLTLTPEEERDRKRAVLRYICRNSGIGPPEASDQVKSACGSFKDGKPLSGRSYPLIGISNELLRLRFALLGGIRVSDVDGYNTTSQDFVCATLRVLC